MFKNMKKALLAGLLLIGVVAPVQEVKAWGGLTSKVITIIAAITGITGLVREGSKLNAVGSVLEKNGICWNEQDGKFFKGTVWSERDNKFWPYKSSANEAENMSEFCKRRKYYLASMVMMIPVWALGICSFTS